MKIKSKDVLKRLEEIDKSEVSNEILTWLISNIPNYIDNHQFVYDLEISIPEREFMPNAYDLQQIYANREKDEDVLTDKEKENIDNLVKEAVSKDEELYVNLANDSLTEESKNAIKEIGNINKALFDFEDQLLTILNENPLKEKLREGLMFYYEISGVKDDTIYLNKKTSALDFIGFTYDDFDMGVTVTMKELNEDTDEEKEVEKTQYVVANGFGITFEIALGNNDESLGVFSMF